MIVLEKNFKFLFEVVMGHLLNLRESIGLLLFLSSFVLSVGLTVNISNLCGIIEIIVKIYAYSYWGGLGTAYFISCIAF